MVGSITPLPIMLEEEKEHEVKDLKPKSVVARYGYMRMIAELPFDLDAKPGCGTKLIIRSPRGTELATMLTSTCPNGGCDHAITRKQMLEYVESSGGKDYPFTHQGMVLRIATIDDVNEQARLDNGKKEMIGFANSLIQELDLRMKLVEAELLLGGERIVFHYTAEQWVDFRELVRRLAREYQTRIEMHQVNARDEARIVADYEKCGQHCCCRQFLKVLKPVSMKSAKVQKATLDPTKISGRCGRLMCCLRYEDETYESLLKRLPRRQTRVMTQDGPGTVVDSQILTQLVLVNLDNQIQTQAYPVENMEILTGEREKKPEDKNGNALPKRGEKRKESSPAQRQPPARSHHGSEIEATDDKPVAADKSAAQGSITEADSGQNESSESMTPGSKGKRRRRRRRRRPKDS